MSDPGRLYHLPNDLPIGPYVPPRPAVRVTVSYPATDGSMPESVDVEWFDPPDVQFVAVVLAQLLAAPTGLFAEPALRVDQCRRLLCGHDRKLHAKDGAGWCLACGSHEKCVTFVGPAPDGSALHVVEGGTE